MSGTLDRYIPEFDEDEARARLAGASAEELTDMLIYSNKLRRVIEKMWAAESNKLKRIEQILAEPSNLSSTPGIPSAEDLRRMMDDE
jgi:hypothetical protein